MSGPSQEAGTMSELSISPRRSGRKRGWVEVGKKKNGSHHHRHHPAEPEAEDSTSSSSESSGGSFGLDSATGFGAPFQILKEEPEPHFGKIPSDPEKFQSLEGIPEAARALLPVSQVSCVIGNI